EAVYGLGHGFGLERYHFELHSERDQRLELLYLLVYLLAHRDDVTAEHRGYGEPYGGLAVVPEHVPGRVLVASSYIGDVPQVDEAVAPAAAYEEVSELVHGRELARRVYREIFLADVYSARVGREILRTEGVVYIELRY